MTGVITFDDYAENVFIPHICNQSSRRVNVVWDTYACGSLKDSTREKRGKGIRRKVSGATKVPPNWMQFLRDSVNKEELFAFLTNKVAEYNWPENKVFRILIFLSFHFYIGLKSSLFEMIYCHFDFVL